MKFFKMFHTMTLPVPAKKCLSIPLREVYLLSKFDKRGSSTSINMADKQNHMTMSILCHQHLRRIALRLFTRICICYASFATVPPLEKEMCLIVKVTVYVDVTSLSPVEKCSYGGFLFRVC